MQEIKHMLEVLFAKTDIVTIESLLDYIQNKGLQDEKEQIQKANMDGYKEGCTYHSFDHRPKTTEQYYNETYKQNES